MGILVVNAGRNKHVQATIDNLKKHTGSENVDVIEFGWAAQPELHQDTTPQENTEELKKVLLTPPIRAKDYDLLLVAGGHGDARLESTHASGFKKTKFNDLTPEGVQELISCLSNNEVTFKNILLGTCFSANFQGDFKKLLKDDTGTILGFTTIATSNLCDLAENISSGKTPDMHGIITHGLLTVMGELKLARENGGTWNEDYSAFTEANFSPLELQLLEDFAAVDRIVATTEKLSNLIDSAEIEYLHNIGHSIDRLEKQRQELPNLGIARNFTIPAKNAIDQNLKKLRTMLSEFTCNPALADQFKTEQQKTDGDQIEKIIKSNVANATDIKAQNALMNLQAGIAAYNPEVSNMKNSLQVIEKELKANSSAALFEFMTKHYHSILNSGNPKLIAGIESSLSIYNNNNIYVRTTMPETLPQDVISASQAEEIPEQLDLIKLEIADMKKQGITIKEISTLEIPTNYANFIHPPDVAQTHDTTSLSSEAEDDSEFDVPEIDTKKLAKPTGTIQKGLIGNFGFFAPKKPKEGSIEPTPQPDGISVDSKNK